MSTLLCNKLVRIGIMAPLAAFMLFGFMTASVPSQQPVAYAATHTIHSTISVDSSLQRAVSNKSTGKWAWLSPRQNCSYLWQEHCRWLQANFSMCSRNYIIYDVTAPAVLGPSSIYPYSTDIWNCGGNSTQIGIHTGYATIYPTWAIHSYTMYYW